MLEGLDESDIGTMLGRVYPHTLTQTSPNKEPIPTHNLMPIEGLSELQSQCNSRKGSFGFDPDNFFAGKIVQVFGVGGEGELGAAVAVHELYFFDVGEFLFQLGEVIGLEALMPKPINNSIFLHIDILQISNPPNPPIPILPFSRDHRKS